MNYFKPQMWLDMNRQGSDRKATADAWDVAFKDYDTQLQELLPKLNVDAQQFFTGITLHDGILTRLEFGDQIDNPIAKNVTDPSAAVRLSALAPNNETIYTLNYRRVARLELKFPGSTVLFPVGEHPNLGDWGYDELTAAGPQSFRHEILFASGATILIEFEEFAFSQSAAQ